MRVSSCNAQLLLLILGVSFAQISAAPAPEPAPCSTEACRQAALYFRENANFTADPCDDFYAYSCGGFAARHPVPPARRRIGVFDIMNDKMADLIRQDLLQVPLPKDDENHQDEEESKQSGRNSSNAVRFGAYLYQRCMAAGSEPDAIAFGNLRNVVKSLVGEWKIGTEQKKSAEDDDLAWYVNYVPAYVAGFASIFQLSVTRDFKNVSKNVIGLDPASLGLGDKELRNLSENVKDIDAYKNFIRSSAQLFCADHCVDSVLERDVNEIVQLESDLAKTRLSIEEMRNIDTVYNVFSVDRLSQITHFEWLANIFVPILRAFDFAASPNDDRLGGQSVIVSDVNYTIAAIGILNRTSPRTLSNYIGWRIVSQLGPYSSEKFRDAFYQFMHITGGVETKEARSESCYEMTYTLVPWSLSRLFVERHFPEAEKREASAVIETIQQSYGELIDENRWLDNVTRRESREKLNHVRKNVAYPDWLLDDASLDQYYALADARVANDLLRNHNYLGSIAQFSAAQLRQSLVTFEDPIDNDRRWPMPPAIINAAYMPDQNSITIPAGILRSPFFDSRRPFGINYGYIGVVIGHEFTHGLDDQGARFDAAGNYHNWWTPEAVKRFAERSQCFVRQYSAQVEPVTGIHLNGENTLGENIADNGGLRESYRAFQTRQTKLGRSPRLADLPALTSEQLFFLSFANTWCSQYRPEALKQQIEYDPHSPSRFRVNVPMSNSAEFASAFHCPLGSRMNPKDKCLLW